MLIRVGHCLSCRCPGRYLAWFRAPGRAALLLALLLVPSAAGAADFVSEQAIRAALLFNFVKFTQWPVTAGDNPLLRVCVATDDLAEFDAIAALDQRRVHGKLLLVSHFSGQTDCAVLYVDTRQRWREVSTPYAAEPVLTIGSYAGFVADGGMIEISLQEARARFDINLREAKRAGLRFYPQLLRLARRVVE